MKLKMEYFSARSERIEAFSRLGAGAVAALVLTAWFGVHGADDPLAHSLLQYGVWLYVFAAAAIVADAFLYPTPKHSRNILSIVLDVVGVTAGLYLGAGIADPLAVFYVWIMLGSGVVYGAGYLVIAATLCASSFALVWSLSPHWLSQPLFSATVMGLILILGPYLTMLMQSLHATRREVRWQADHDPLTGLLNRRAFRRDVDAAMVKARPHSAMLYFDLDHFKAVNDQAGHAAGDQVLVDVTALIRTHTPPQAIASRLGGDEFSVYLPASSLTDARKIADTLRSEIASYRLAWGTEYYRIGVSIGVAPGEAAATADALTRLADAACYGAKNGGRNQVHVVDDGLNASDTQRLRLVKNTA
ncbi:MAG: GGDEF domain-containing protein [Pseudomonadota bacterium]